jgi:predicted phosphoribosyltransferase
MLRNRAWVFRDRIAAGETLAQLLQDYRDSDAVVLGIPAGGMPVATVVARALNLPLDAFVVSKITLPWNTEAGYGAMADDGLCRLNEHLVREIGLDAAAIAQGKKETEQKIARRAAHLRQLLPAVPLAGRTVILVDDGLASGFTLRVALESLRQRGVAKLIIAVPTGHGTSVGAVAADADELYCANIREGFRFAVADAYEEWRDVDEGELDTLLRDAAATSR